jgi:hypothetical protein
MGVGAASQPPISIWAIPHAHRPQTVTLAWDYSTDPAVDAYEVYWGPSSRTYTNLLSDILTNRASLTNLGQGTFYFAATAVDTNGLISDFSNEVVWTNLAPPLVTNFLLSVSIHQSTDFTNWSVLTNFSLNVSNTGQPLYWRALMNIQPQ